MMRLVQTTLLKNAPKHEPAARCPDGCCCRRRASRTASTRGRERGRRTTCRPSRVRRTDNPSYGRWYPLLFPANPSIQCHPLFRDARRRTPRPRRVGRRATCQLTSLSEARRPETRGQCVCGRLAGEVIKHDDSDETLKALFSFALERWKRQFPDRTFGIFVWCAMRGLDVCRPAESPFLAGQSKTSG